MAIVHCPTAEGTPTPAAGTIVAAMGLELVMGDVTRWNTDVKNTNDRVRCQTDINGVRTA